MANSFDLRESFAECIVGLAIEKKDFGRANLIEKEAKSIYKAFQTNLTAKFSEQNAYSIALKLMQGHQLDEAELDQVASAISLPIKECNGLTVLESSHILPLLEKYEEDLKDDCFSRLTWYRLFNSYLTVDLKKIHLSGYESRFDLLRGFLEKTWRYISAADIVPDWVKVLRSNQCLLSEKPVDQYVQDVLEGNSGQIESLAKNLCIPQSSWFWEKLMLTSVERATACTDTVFKQYIPLIIGLIEVAHVHRDEAIALVLNRYFICETKEVHPQLRDFVIDVNVWKNPKLKSVGIATAWNQVEENVWKMVLGWVNERNLKDFFQILAARSHSDHGRLEFWSKYLEQIVWTKLVFGGETLCQKQKNESIRKLLEAEEGSYAQFDRSADWELDAFLMQINDYVFVEFSKKNNGAYGYKMNDLKFNLHAKHYRGSTTDLKYGFHEYNGPAMKIIHGLDWEEITEDRLRKIGIFPDKKRKLSITEKREVVSEHLNSLNYLKGILSVDTERINKSEEPATTIPDKTNQSHGSYATDDKAHLSASNRSFSIHKSTKFDENFINSIKERYPSEATVQDLRSKLGGRLWVYSDSYALGKELKALGFYWSNKRNGWYLRED